jgi:hypothetical protein
VPDRERALAPVGAVLRAHERMRHEVGDAAPVRVGRLVADALVEIGDHLVDVAPQSIDLGELCLRDVRGRHVDVAAILGERRGHLGADEDVLEPRVEHHLDAVDRVVVRERHEVHPARLQHPVVLERVRVGLRDRERVGSVVVGDVRGVRVDVEIDARRLALEQENLGGARFVSHGFPPRSCRGLNQRFVKNPRGSHEELVGIRDRPRDGRARIRRRSCDAAGPRRACRPRSCGARTGAAHRP